MWHCSLYHQIAPVIGGCPCPQVLCHFVIPLQDFQHKAILCSTPGEGGSPATGSNLLWWQQLFTVVGHEEAPVSLLADTAGTRVPEGLSGGASFSLCPFPHGSTSSAVPHRAAQQLSLLCCSVNAQLLQPKAAKIHPSPLKFRDSFMLAAHMINQTNLCAP